MGTYHADLVTRELSTRTWQDFEKLFGRRGEWGACWCVYYQRAKPLPRADREQLTPEQRADRNRRDKKEMVERGCSHGILVYDGVEPVGWCQYGPKEEAPRIDAGRKYRKLPFANETERLWRITCFSVDRRYRKRRVASVGLAAALESISRQGGGLVEAYPVTRRGALSIWFGTVSMFKRHGFRIVAPFGRSNVVMRRRIPGRMPARALSGVPSTSR
jgi:Acetyltransferase (GNAT) family